MVRKNGKFIFKNVPRHAEVTIHAKHLGEAWDKLEKKYKDTDIGIGEWVFLKGEYYTTLPRRN